jgi:glycosyltransferase involved in cell wall biosynthesis
MNKNITAMVFTRNEIKRLPFLYRNLKDFCEIIVFDGGSTDGTEEYCRQNGIRFVSRPEDNAIMRLKTLAWVYERVPTDYVMQVYGAHFFPKALLQKFSEIADENQKDAVFNDLVVYRYGDVVHRPHFRRISSVCLFYKKSIINFEKSKIHDELGITFNAQTMIRLPGKDDLALHLFQDEDCESFTKKTINYEALEARQRFDAGERMTGVKLLFGPVGRFIYRYLRTGSFTRGTKGLVYSVLNFIYDLNVCIILWELSNQITYENAVRKNSEKKTQLLDMGY